MKNSISKPLIIIFLLFFGTSIFSQEDEINKNSDIANLDADKQHPLLANRFTFYVGLYSSIKEIGLTVNGATENEIIDFSESVVLTRMNTPYF